MDFDVVVIGSGPGGYVAAIRCAQLGLKAALVEKYATLGGTCLNVGCIPSKALLDSSELYYSARKSFATHGIRAEGLGYDWMEVQSRKGKVVSDTCKGVQYLMDKNGVATFQGTAAFESSHTLSITGGEGKAQTVSGKNVIIATGSKPSDLPHVRIDKRRIVSSTEALSFPTVPDRLLIVGAGVIGVELGSIYARLGSKVTILEYLPNVIPTMDRTLGRELLRVLKKMEIGICLEQTVLSAENRGETVAVRVRNKQGEEIEHEAEFCLVAVGRKPYTEGLDLEKAGIGIDQQGFIDVNDRLETSQKGVYAIGDVIGGAMLAHKAEEEGVMVAELIAGQDPHINYLAIPSVAYTWPEVASVGFTEEQLKQRGTEYRAGRFSFRALGRARAANELDGLVKVLADAETDEILGIHMIGARTADMIGEAVVAMEYRASAEDIARMPHAHPTFTEALKEACLDATGKRSLHM